MIRLVEVTKEFKAYSLREIFINPEHVISLREDIHMKQSLTEGKMTRLGDLSLQQSFTKLVLDKGTVGLEITVVGAPILIESKLREGQELLHG
tara:strand:- start:2976 stop:3254 length:279 start_codon:yes stop_codon:yes gene_type:complete